MSAQRAVRVAAIDLGSNAVRLLIADVRRGQPLRVIEEARVPTQLARGMATSGRIWKRAEGPTLEAVKSYMGRCREHGVERVRAVATSAMRDARGGPALARRIERAAGVRIEIIDQDEEARLAFSGAAARLDLSRGTSAVVDIGAGSLQIIFSKRGVICRTIGLPLGARRMTDAFGGPDAIRSSKRAAFIAHVRAVLRGAAADLPFRPTRVIGTGGSFTTYAALTHGAAGGREGPLEASGLSALARALVRTCPDYPDLVLSVPEDRRDITYAGAVVGREVLRMLSATQARVFSGGLREGLAYDLGVASPDADVMTGVRRLARSCRYERAHSEHVAKLAAGLLALLADLPRVARVLALREDAAVLLRAAAVLHDIGTMVDYESHHKCSRDIILAASLPGLDPTQRLIVASTARYHRRSGPAEAHEHFARLAVRDRRVVELLSGVLRVADGLDRTHDQRVRGLRLAGGDSRTLRILVRGTRGAGACVRAALEKSDVLARVIGLEIAIAL
jgi:exopolyphosphatase/guanosine-5'-triphosphate,3'-diphosphate pyrophosphatase